jgi:hypothetical protein
MIRSSHPRLIIEDVAMVAKHQNERGQKPPICPWRIEVGDPVSSRSASKTRTRLPSPILACAIARSTVCATVILVATALLNLAGFRVKLERVAVRVFRFCIFVTAELQR